MNCKQAKTEIALLVGGDPGESTVAKLQGHLDDCHCCRDYQRQMTACLGTLKEPDDYDGAPVTGGESLWPRVASQLPRRDTAWKMSRFNGWVPAALIAASCMVILYSSLRSQFQAADPPVIWLDSVPNQIPTSNRYSPPRSYSPRRPQADPRMVPFRDQQDFRPFRFVPRDATTEEQTRGSNDSDQTVE